MRLSTLILRNPFGLPGTMHVSEVAMTEIDLWKRERHKRCVEHFRDVVRALEHLNQNPLSITSGYRHDDHPADRDSGPIGEWWTVIAYDGPPE